MALPDRLDRQGFLTALRGRIQRFYPSRPLRRMKAEAMSTSGKSLEDHDKKVIHVNKKILGLAVDELERYSLR